MSAVQPDDADRDALFARYAVSRETALNLARYAELLIEHQAMLNLVGPATIPQLWNRHMLDSAQLLDYIPATANDLIDLGSGAGFPALVLAMLKPDLHVTLVESRAKKCRFLEEVIAATGLQGRAVVANARAEALAAQPYAVISARALASLSQLLDWGLRFQSARTLWVLPKGRSVEQEVEEAKQAFRFGHALKPSLTDSEARILLAWQVERRAKGRT
jgi:16S rRNA (guanine527-N7)-methyltransferase